LIRFEKLNVSFRLITKASVANYLTESEMLSCWLSFQTLLVAILMFFFASLNFWYDVRCSSIASSWI